MKVYKIVSNILKEMVEMAEPGVKKIDINNHAAKLIKKYGCKSYNKGYMPSWGIKPYPAETCINTDFIIAHGIPTDEELREGQIVSFDLGIIDKDGNCGDAAVSIGLGEITPDRKRLLYYAYETMMAGISQMKAGVNTQTVTRAIESFALSRGYRVNKRFAGHRIDKEMHLKPNIYNTTEDSHIWGVLQEGEVYCIEPMVTNGIDNMGRMMNDNWTFITQDGKPSAFFENMVEVTKDGAKILTDHIVPPTL